VDGGSKVAEILGTNELKVNSYHHQAIKELASGLVTVAYASDGVIEAVESSDLLKRWIIGVQWHAEAMRDAGPEHCNLFEAHVSAAKRYALRHAAA
jgi:putative glutamine amidotransferase